MYSALSEEQKTANLDNIIVRKMDVTSDESVHSCISDILHETGDKIDIIINNAGYGIAGCLESVSIEDAQKVFNVNVWGVVRVLQSVLPSMRSRKNGHIINISSTSGVRGIPCMEYYSGSKFALEGIADSMRYSLAAYNISVTQVNPGPVRTKFTDTFGDISKGGRGTRHVEGEEQINHPNPLPHLSYLNSLTTMMIDSLNRRMASPEAQSSESVAHVIVHLAIIKLNSNRIEDVPFTMGTNSNSQAVIEQVKRNPTGWGGMYGKLLMSIPPIPKPPTLHKNQHNREEDEGRDEL
jgi:NADP-dependent 3-hydroxy acid dehydrogenase YdfG